MHKTIFARLFYCCEELTSVQISQGANLCDRLLKNCISLTHSLTHTHTHTHARTHTQIVLSCDFISNSACLAPISH